MVFRRPNLAEGIDHFTLYCRSKGLAPRTIETYTYSLKCLVAFLQWQEEDPAIPNCQQLRRFMASMLEKDLSRATIRVRMRSVRCFCNFLEREGIVQVSPMVGVEIPRVPLCYPEILSADQIARFLKRSNRTNWTGVRNHVILLTFLDTGVRLGELIRLNLADLDLRNLALRVRYGKGGKERYVFVGRSLCRAMRKWLDIRGDYSPELPLFMTRDGTRLSHRNVERIVERLAKKAGLDGVRVTPHILRHTFATHYIKNGGDPFSLQRILGHSDIKTTMIYVNLAGVGLREAHAKASPVDRLLSGT